MPKDFLSLVRRSSDLVRALRKITVGSAIAATGVSATPSPATAAQLPGTLTPQGLTPIIVDRARKAGKLVLQLPGATTAYLRAEHRSHRSHSSHRSHFSSSGGGSAPAPAPPVTRTPPPVRTAPGESTLDLTEPAPANAITGEIVAIDADARTVTIRQSATMRATFAYRDDSKFETSLGVGVRFDDFASANDGRLPITMRDKVQITWRTAPDGKTQIVTSAKKVP